MFAQENPLGQTLILDLGEPTPHEVVGVVVDAVGGVVEVVVVGRLLVVGRDNSVGTVWPNAASSTPEHPARPAAPRAKTVETASSREENLAGGRAVSWIVDVGFSSSPVRDWRRSRP